MIAKLLISPSLKIRIEEIGKILSTEKLTNPHPDLLYFASGEKLGVEQAKKIKKHFSLKPYSAQGRLVVMEDASDLTIEAQNALLKTLEELPEKAMIILAADSDSKFLPTVLSRCEIIKIHDSRFMIQDSNYKEDIEKLLEATIEERFEYIEKLKDREEFLHSLITYFHQNLASNLKGYPTNFLKELLQAEEWVSHNVNIRAILEYLMLKMPTTPGITT